MANLLISNGTWSDPSHWVTLLISDKKISLSNLQNVI
jgi:Fe-S cluster biosynthesis and repair protein YggX